MATADVVVGQGTPELAQLVCEACKAPSDDGVHIERLHLVRVLGDEVTELVPQLQGPGISALVPEQVSPPT